MERAIHILDPHPPIRIGPSPTDENSSEYRFVPGGPVVEASKGIHGASWLETSELGLVGESLRDGFDPKHRGGGAASVSERLTELRRCFTQRAALRRRLAPGSWEL